VDDQRAADAPSKASDPWPMSLGDELGVSIEGHSAPGRLVEWQQPPQFPMHTKFNQLLPLADLRGSKRNRPRQRAAQNYGHFQAIFAVKYRIDTLGNAVHAIHVNSPMRKAEAGWSTGK
jgi:hypothetical protein